MPTRTERIAQLQEALERHKRLALLLTSSLKITDRVVTDLLRGQAKVQEHLKSVEREIGEAESHLSKLESACPICDGSGRKLVAIGEFGACDCQSQSPVGTDAAPEPLQPQP
jgi:hypothetical protein